jgi:hypothetical protein
MFSMSILMLPFNQSTVTNIWGIEAGHHHPHGPTLAIRAVTTCTGHSSGLHSMHPLHLERYLGTCITLPGEVNALAIRSITVE